MILSLIIQYFILLCVIILSISAINFRNSGIKRLIDRKSTLGSLFHSPSPNNDNERVPISLSSEYHRKIVHPLRLATFISTLMIPSGIESANALERQLVYSVEFTQPPSLLPRTPLGEENVAKRLSQADVSILGEHHYSFDDHTLQVHLSF